MPASYAGIEFGFVFKMNVAANPNAKQINAYCGANGLEVIDHGTRGGTTVVEFGMIAGSVAALVAAEEELRDLQLGGQPHTLVDSRDTTWENVILLDFRPVGPTRPLATFPGSYAQKYGAEFLHI